MVGVGKDTISHLCARNPLPDRQNMADIAIARPPRIGTPLAGLKDLWLAPGIVGEFRPGADEGGFRLNQELLCLQGSLVQLATLKFNLILTCNNNLTHLHLDSPCE